jgi:uncharacterized protein (DUF305 family)
MTSTRILAILAALVTAAVLSACSSTPAADGHTDHDHGTSESSVVAGEPAGFDADDVAFATNMIPHHQQAVELSTLVPDRSTDPDVIALAQQIAAAQQPEIETMKAFLVQWKENPGDETGHGAHGGAAMGGMVDQATMAKLATLKGTAFDTLWLQSMIGHHQGAIEMANAELANGQNVDAKQLAQTIIDAQQAEIDQMQKMLGSTP